MPGSCDSRGWLLPGVAPTHTQRAGSLHAARALLPLRWDGREEDVRRRLRLQLSSLLCRARRGGTCGRGPGVRHSVTFVTEELFGPAVISGTLAMVFLLGRSQGCRQLLGHVKSCGLTFWELSSSGLSCAKSQWYPVPKHSGGAGSGTEVVPPSFLPFQAVSGLQQVPGLGLEARGVGKGLCHAAALGQGGR